MPSPKGRRPRAHRRRLEDVDEGKEKEKEKEKEDKEKDERDWKGEAKGSFLQRGILAQSTPSFHTEQDLGETAIYVERKSEEKRKRRSTVLILDKSFEIRVVSTANRLDANFTQFAVFSPLFF
jgi:hypothetical protein